VGSLTVKVACNITGSPDTWTHHAFHGNYIGHVPTIEVSSVVLIVKKLEANSIRGPWTCGILKNEHPHELTMDSMLVTEPTFQPFRLAMLKSERTNFTQSAGSRDGKSARRMLNQTYFEMLYLTMPDMSVTAETSHSSIVGWKSKWERLALLKAEPSNFIQAAGSRDGRSAGGMLKHRYFEMLYLTMTDMSETAEVSHSSILGWKSKWESVNVPKSARNLIIWDKALYKHETCDVRRVTYLS
jgi:hypothetical protein